MAEWMELRFSLNNQAERVDNRPGLTTTSLSTFPRHQTSFNSLRPILKERFPKHILSERKFFHSY